MLRISHAALLEIANFGIASIRQRTQESVAIEVFAEIEFQFRTIQSAHETFVGQLAFEPVVCFGRHDDQRIASIACHRHGTVRCCVPIGC